MRAIRNVSLSLAASATLLSLPATMLSAAAVTSPTAAAPSVALVSDSADINASQFIDDTNQAGTDTPDSQFLTFDHRQVPPAISTSDATASSAASQSALLSTAATPPLPVNPLDDISLAGASSSRATASGRTVPIATSNGTLSVQFTTSGSVPVFFTGAEHTSNTDPSNSCSLASVVLTGPVTRTFVASTGNGCKSAEPHRQQWAQALTLPAGSYSLDVDYATNAFDDVVNNNDPGSVAGSASLSLNLGFFPPTAHFTSSVSGVNAEFNGVGSLPGRTGRPVSSWRWDFGDGTRAVTTRPQTSHTYPASPLMIRTYRVTLQVVDVAHVLAPATAHFILGTATTVAVSKTVSRLHVSGVVRPNRPAHSVVVTLSRKRSGTFHAVATHRPVLSPRSRFTTAFKRTAAGTCRLTARYPGDATHLASTSQRTFPC